MKESTQRILELFGQGLGVSDIARAVGCTKPNVTQVLRHHVGGYQQYMVLALPEPERKWLARQAKTKRKTYRELVRVILIEAVRKEMGNGLE